MRGDLNQLSFSFHLTDQFLKRGETVVGTVRNTVHWLIWSRVTLRRFRAKVLDMTDRAATRQVVEGAFARLGHMSSPVGMRAKTSEGPIAPARFHQV